jgi:PAS domain S-box-containing protein
MKFFSDKNQTIYSVILFVVLSSGVMIGGYINYENFRRVRYELMENTLTAIADLQCNQIDSWRSERISDAHIFFKNEIFSDILNNYYNNPLNNKYKQILSGWVNNIQQNTKYDRVSILDVHSKVIIAAPDTAAAPSFIIDKIPEVISSREIKIIDLYRSPTDGKTYISILIPVLVTHPSLHAIGIVVIRINPEHNVFEFVRKFPIPSRSAETLIFRREGDEIVYLNDMKLISKKSMSYRVPITRTDLPAVKAILGNETTMFGVDYRGIPVIACTRKIQDSPWYIVVKMDKKEAEEPIAEKLWQIQFFILALIAGSGGFIGFTIKSQHNKILNEQLKAVKQQKFLQDIIQNSLNEIYIFNADSLLFTYVNDASCRNLQYTQDEMMTLTPVDIKPDFTKESYSKLVQPLILKTERILTFETIHRRKDRSTYPVEVHLQLVESGDENLIVTFVNNITKRKKAMTDLVRSNKELEQFAYVASHDLQEPLRMVSSYTQLLASRYKDKLDSDANDFIQFAVDGSIRMHRLINDLLDYSRVTTRGKEFETVNLNSVVGEVIVMLQQKISEENAIITNAELPEIKGDRSQITRLFQNLIDNAIKYRRMELQPVIHISFVEMENEYEFLVQDNGIGIDEKYKDRIFVIFQRLHSKEEYSGSGIGLSICKRIVDRHQGAIWFQSIPGSGTTFHFTLSKHLKNDQS